MLATRSDGYYEDAAATHGMGNTGAFTAAKEIIKKRFDLLRILLQTFLRAQHPRRQHPGNLAALFRAGEPRHDFG
jgi:hypothetical protein